MQVAGISEILVPVYQIAQCNILEYYNFHSHRRENLKTRNIFMILNILLNIKY